MPLSFVSAGLAIKTKEYRTRRKTKEQRKPDWRGKDIKNIRLENRTLLINHEDSFIVD